MTPRARMAWVGWVPGWVLWCTGCDWRGLVRTDHPFLFAPERPLEALPRAHAAATAHVRTWHTDAPIEEPCS